MKTDQFLPFFKQKSFSAGITLFLINVFVNLEDAFLTLSAIRPVAHNAGVPVAVECYVVVTGSRE